MQGQLAAPIANDEREEEREREREITEESQCLLYPNLRDDISSLLPYSVGRIDQA